MNIGSINKPQMIKTIILFFIGIVILGISAYFFLPNPIDWTISYRPAALTILSGESPYNGNLPIYNPPWTLLPLIPFALLPYRIGVGCLFVANFVAFIYVGWRLGGNLITIGALITSFPVAFSLLFGQVDALVYLGLVLPRSIGLFFIMSKPQIGIVVAIFWLVEEWKEGGWKQTLRTFFPVFVAFLLSFIIYGTWPLNILSHDLIHARHNTSLWPLSIPIGLPLLIYALRKRKQNFALLSGPFFSPYVAPLSWSFSLLGLLHFLSDMVAVCLSFWCLFFFRFLL
jgi:hypothetical protein